MRAHGRHRLAASRAVRVSVYATRTKDLATICLYRGGGFNAFRQWPSEAAVSLTGRAQTFFGVGEGAQLTFTEIGELNKLDAGVLAGVMADMPMADQRGESVLLDAVDGQLEWITVVRGARALG